MARKALIEVLGDARSFVATLRQSASAVRQSTTEFDRLATSATKSADSQVKAAVRTQARLKEQAAAYKAIAASAQKGSREQVAAANLAANAQNKLARSLASTAREQSAFAAAAGRSARGMRGAGSEFSSLGRGAIVGSGALRALGRSVAFASAGFLGSAGLVYGLRSSITATGQFDDALQRVIGLAGGSAAQIAKVRGELLTLAPAVGTTPQELAEAFYQISSSGVDASQAMNVLVDSAKAATAGLGDTQVVADAVTSAMNAYGSEVLSAQKATDILAAAVREGKGEASQFAPVIGNVSALASQLGVSFNEVAAALAAQTRLGVDAETASVQLQALFSGLLKTMPKAEKAFEKVGLSSKGLREELSSRGLLATLETIRKAFGGNAQALATAFPNIRALRGLLALVGKQADATAGIFNRMRDTTGSLATAFNAVKDDPAVRFAKTRAAAQSLEIEIGSALLPSVLKLTDGFTEWASKSENQQKLNHAVAEAAQTLVGALHAAQAILVPLAKGADGFAHSIGGWKTTLELAAGAWAGFKAAGVAAAIAVQAANIAAAFGVESAWRAALISTGWGALAVAAGIAAAYVITHWQKVKGWFSTFWTALKDTGAAAWEAMKQLAKGAVYAILQYATIAVQGILKIASHIPYVGDKAKAALKNLQTFINNWKPDGTAITDHFANLGAQAGSAFANQVAAYIAASTALAVGGTPLGPPNPNGPKPIGSRNFSAGFSTTTPTTGIGGTTDSGLGTSTGSGSGGSKSFTLPLRLQIEQAKASATAGQADDVKAARDVAAYIKTQIATGKLKGQILVGAWNDLSTANQTIAQASKDAADKAAAATKAQRDALKKQTDTLKKQLTDVKQTIAQRLDDARSSIGDLLSDAGPSAASLGATGPPISVLTGNIKSQNATFAQFQHDLATIARRSHSSELVKELRAAGVGSAAEVHTIATSSTKDLNAFLKSFAQRETLAAKAANIAQLTAKQVNLTASLVRLQGDPTYYATATDARDRPQTIIVEIDGRQVAKVIAPHQARAPKRGSQARGRR